mgnify:CR=1 FL=1
MLIGCTAKLCGECTESADLRISTSETRPKTLKVSKILMKNPKIWVPNRDILKILKKLKIKEQAVLNNTRPRSRYA